jgi:Double zinc ribbon
MYCPECGNDVQDANFCAECGADLRALAGPPSCAACGAEAPDGARFCPECGEALGGAASARAKPEGGGRRTGTRGRGAGGSAKAAPRPKPQPPRRAPVGKTAPGAGRRLSPALIWGGFAAAAAVVIVVVILISGGSGPSGSAAASGTQSVQPVAADTSGTYAQLVQRANDLYDQGSQAFTAKNYTQGSAYFDAASKVYAVAWAKQSTEPGVGTDYATSLFYAGKIDAAVAQVDKVIARAPTFQTAWFNKGNYLAEKARQAGQNGDSKGAKTIYAGARTAYQKAIQLGASTETGQQAQQRLDALPK